MTVEVDADYLVVGAGAAGLAFTDALTREADVRVAIVDRRPGPGGHWLDAYPFVQLHQASSFYGVASTVLGTGSIQTRAADRLRPFRLAGAVEDHPAAVRAACESSKSLHHGWRSHHLAPGRRLRRIAAGSCALRANPWTPVPPCARHF